MYGYMQECGKISPIGDINMACHVYIIKTACMMLFWGSKITAMYLSELRAECDCRQRCRLSAVLMYSV